MISTQFPRRRAAAPIRRPCRPPQRTLSPREVGEATVLAAEHGLQSTRDCAEAARAPPSTRHPNQRQSGRSVAGGAPLPALRPHFSIVSKFFLLKRVSLETRAKFRFFGHFRKNRFSKNLHRKICPREIFFFFLERKPRKPRCDRFVVLSRPSWQPEIA